MKEATEPDNQPSRYAGKLRLLIVIVKTSTRKIAVEVQVLFQHGLSGDLHNAEC